MEIQDIDKVQGNSMKKCYADWSEEYPNHLVLIRAGFFYMAWGRSAEVLNEILDYKLVYSSKRKVPYTGGTSLSAMQAALERNSINYLVIEGGDITEKCEFASCDEVFYDSKYFEKSDPSKMNDISDEDLIYAIENLLEGINPTTGEFLDEDHIMRDAVVQTALSIALKTIYRKQNQEKNRGSSSGAKWSKDEDSKLMEEYRNHLPIDEIAKLHGRSSSAITNRIVKLGLIEL